MLINENSIAGAPQRPPPPALRVHGRKRSHRLSHRGQHLLDGLLPLLRVSFDAATQDPSRLFAAPPREVWLEIGFGDGGHLASMAEIHSDIGFIGCEPYVNGVAHLLAGIEAKGLGNIRIHAGDARDLLAALPAASLALVFILFPDPWPRKRHHKRRFISPDNLDALARVMQPGAELRFASDSADYCQWTLQHMRNHPGFTGAGPEASGAPVTKYGAKARAAGRTARYLRFVRAPA